MKSKAAIAWKSGAPQSTETVDLNGPRWGEALIEIKASGICHTDYCTVSGADPEGQFPVILEHEGAGVVLDIGPGVTHLQKDIYKGLDLMQRGESFRGVVRHKNPVRYQTASSAGKRTGSFNGSRAAVRGRARRYAEM